MLCPICSKTISDGATFCPFCGAQMSAGGSTAAPGSSFAAPGSSFAAPVPGPRTPAPSPFAAPAAAPSGSARTVLGMRGKVMLAGALLTLVLMFQSWVSLPCVGNGINLAIDEMYSNSYIIYWGLDSTTVKSMVGSFYKEGYTAPDLLGLASSIDAAHDVLDTALSSSSSNMSNSELSQARSSVDAIASLSFALKVPLVLWALALVAVVVGTALKLFSGNDLVLRVALIAAALSALVGIVVALVVNAQIDSGIDTLMDYSSYDNSDIYEIQAILQDIRPWITPALGSIGTLVCAGATAVASFIVKE